jgi:dipeptidyl aminopeptidase/acylaminoacyl peptidase
MSRRYLRALAGLGLLSLVLLAASAQARSFTLDDLLSLERLDGAQITPDGQRLIVQTEAAYDTAARFDFDEFGAPLLGRIKIASLNPVTPARDLLPPAPGAGDLAGPLSPSGRAMVVQRLAGGVWDTGVVQLDTGAVRWLGVPTETAGWGRSLAWRDDRHLIALVLPPGLLPARLRTLWQTTDQLTALWRQAAAGAAPTAHLVGSGADLGLWPAAPAMRLVEIDVANGQVHDLAQAGFVDLELSADRRFAALLSDEEAEQPDETDVVRVGTPGRRRSLTLVDLVTGAVTRPLPGRDLATDLLAWSPSTDRILVFARRLGARWEDGEILAVDASSGAVQAPGAGHVVADVAYVGAGVPTVRAAWLDETPLVFARPVAAPSARADWFALTASGPENLTAALPAANPRLAAIDSHAALMLAGDQIYRLAPDGPARSLARSAGLRVLETPAFDQGDRFGVNDPPQRSWTWLADAAGAWRTGRGAPAPRLALAPDETALAAGPGVLAVLRHDARGVSTLVAATPAGRTAVATINAALAQVDPLQARPIRHLDPQGRPVTSWLFLPPAAAPGHPPPLVVLPYPGALYPKPPGRYAPDALVFTPNARLLTAHGYAVLAPSLPRDAAPGEPAQGLAAQILTAVDAVLAQGLADPKRLAIWGHSFGGYGALITAAQTGRFQAVVAQAAKTDLAAGWGAEAPAYRVRPEDGPMLNAAAGWTETGQGGLGTTPWRDPDRYRRNSPLFLADQIHAPVFLIQGDLDFVTLANGEAMFAALYRQNREARFMTLFGEGHVVGSPANVRAVYGAVLPWLDQKLGFTPSSSAPTSDGPSAPSP